MTNLSVRDFLAANHFTSGSGLRALLPAGHPGLRFFLGTTPFSPDRLKAFQQLRANQELVSPNGWLNLTVQASGDITLVRTMFGVQLWSTDTGATPAATLLMQPDGNLVALSAAGAQVWSSGTGGNPGAFCVLQDDGNLVIYNAAGAAPWASNTVQDFTSPAYSYQGTDTFSYDETSESWKVLCQALPCCDALQWPDYATKHVDATISGQAVVIQLWKGSCPKFLGLNSFPGGVGAEVGIYRRIPGRPRPTAASLQFLPAALVTLVVNSIANLVDDDLWWPYPELGAVLDYTLINPNTQQPFFSAGPETTYWLAKWMYDSSYHDYQTAQGSGNTPGFSTGYTLKYRVNGMDFAPW